MIPIKSIEEELADCRRAWRNARQRKMAWCCHHEVRLEPLMGTWQDRIRYIQNVKPLEEQAIRFHNFRPVWVVLPAALLVLARKYRTAMIATKRMCARVAVAEGLYMEDGTPAEARQRKAWDRSRAVYHKAMEHEADTWQAYEAKMKALSVVIAKAHNKDYYDHTWNGTSIFADT